MDFYKAPRTVLGTWHTLHSVSYCCSGVWPKWGIKGSFVEPERSSSSVHTRERHGEGHLELQGFPGKQGRAYPGNPIIEADARVFHQQLPLRSLRAQEAHAGFLYCQPKQWEVLTWSRELLGVQKLGRYGVQPGAVAFDESSEKKPRGKTARKWIFIQPKWGLMFKYFPGIQIKKASS